MADSIQNNKAIFNAISSYQFTENESLRTQSTKILKKLTFHNFSGLNKDDLFADYNNNNEERKYGFKIVNEDSASGSEQTYDDYFFEFVNTKALIYSRNTNLPKGTSLRTYPEKKDVLGKDIEEWNKVFKEYEEELSNDKKRYNLETKVYDVKKKYTNELESIKLSTAVKEWKNLQDSKVGCVDCGADENCLYLVLNDGCYEIVCGGLQNYSILDLFYAFVDYISGVLPTQVVAHYADIMDALETAYRNLPIIIKYITLVIPSSAILNMGVNCENNSDCSSCQCNCEGKCCLFKIDLNNCYVYCNFEKKEENPDTGKKDNYGFRISVLGLIYTVIMLVSNANSNVTIAPENITEFMQVLKTFIKSIVKRSGAYFYFVKKETIPENSNDEIHYKIVNEEDAELNGKKYKNPYGTLWFDNRGKKIVREHFAYPIGWHTVANVIPFLPIIFENTYANICNYFQIEYNYWEVKDAYFTIDKFSEIEYKVSYNQTYKDDKLLLGTVEIPKDGYYPSFDSTLNINEDCQKSIADIRQNKLIEDNHQRIRFTEICNQTNRENLSNFIYIVPDTSRLK